MLITEAVEKQVRCSEYPACDATRTYRVPLDRHGALEDVFNELEKENGGTLTPDFTCDACIERMRVAIKEFK